MLSQYTVIGYLRIYEGQCHVFIFLKKKYAHYFKNAEEIPEKIELSTIEDAETPVADQVVKEINEKNAKIEVTKKKITKRTQSRG